MAQPGHNANNNNLIDSIRRIEGAYSLVIMTANELIGVRDPHGFRPSALTIGDAWVLASELAPVDVDPRQIVRRAQVVITRRRQSVQGRGGGNREGRAPD